MINEKDLKRKYCPITVRVICAPEIAKTCKYFKHKENCKCSSRE